MKLWLMKSEPDVYSIDDLAGKGQGTWEGVRNFQARNYLRAMERGDLFFFYHSNASPPGVVGLGRIVREAYDDPFQFDPKSPYHDPTVKPDAPRWSAVDVAFVEKFRTALTLDVLRGDPALEGLVVLQRGSRLSVTPVDPLHAAHLLRLAGAKTKLPKPRRTS